MILDETLLQGSEKITFALRGLYQRAGFMPYRMSKFEEYDLYARNKEFLLSDNVITFTDTNGRLMALKPDVTLSIIKNSKDLPHETQKVYYNENVYRVSRGTGTFREIMQTGLECFGAVSDVQICQVLKLAVQSLETVSENCVLEVSDLTMLETAVSALSVPGAAVPAIYKAISEKNRHELSALCAGDPAAEELLALTELCGTLSEILPILKRYCGRADASHLTTVLEALASDPAAEKIRVDFSVTDDIQYYNGVVFKGFLAGVPNAVLSGGQYDRLMRKLQRQSDAVGFAVYLDGLDRAAEAPMASQPQDGYLNVALPKGRLGEKVYAMFAAAGFECPSILEPNRRLIFENPETKVRYFWVKPSDVAIYVERGAADLGVAGKDILLEYGPEVYELADLHTGKCRMAVAAPRGFTDDPSRTLRVATKFANIAGQFYQSHGRDIDIIHLNGSIELAPILGLSDVIVDIVETGTTLRENNLEVYETILPISARLIANKASCKFKKEQIGKVVTAFSALTEEKK